MRIGILRWLILSLAFGLLLFGACAGLHLGSILPTFSCCFVPTRAGTCFFLPLQLSLGSCTWPDMLLFFERLFWFSLLVLLIGRAWCGWICPLGFFQDLLDGLRRAVGLGYARFSAKWRARLGWVKWIFLGVALLIPIWGAFPVLFAPVALDLNIPFCQLCPGKYLLPLITFSRDRILVDFESTTRMVMSSLGLLFSVMVIIGAFVKRRFWCPYCPLGLMMSWYRRWSLLKLKKDDATCTHCQVCANVCPMDIEEVFLSRGRVDVTFSDCILCLKCIEHCPEDNALRADFFGKTLYRSTAHSFFNHPALVSSEKQREKTHE
nr:4Fe-4S binding protein [uncultured Desulfobulbus sp.]